MLQADYPVPGVSVARRNTPAVVGEIAALDGGTRTADVVAEIPTTLIRIGREDLLNVMNKHPSVAQRAITVLCEHVRRASDVAEDAALRDQRSRLARLLLGMANDAGLIKPVTQRTLAEMLGTQREVVHRIIREFRGTGILGQQKDRIRVLDKIRLKNLAHT